MLILIDHYIDVRFHEHPYNVQHLMPLLYTHRPKHNDQLIYSSKSSNLQSLL